MDSQEVEVLEKEEAEQKAAEINKEQGDQMVQTANTFLKIAKDYEIKNVQQMETADEFCARALKNKNEAEAFFKPQKKFFDDKKAVILKEEKKVVVPLNEGRDLLKGKIQKYKKVLAAEDEKKRVAAAEQHTKELEALQKVERDKKIAQAEALEAQGKDDEAEQLLDAPSKIDTTAPPPVIAHSQPKMKTTIPEAWDYKVIDERQVPRGYLMLDDKKLRAQCKATKKDTNIKGIRAYDKNAA